jgi:hypothetical protein
VLAVVLGERRADVALLDLCCPRVEVDVSLTDFEWISKGRRCEKVGGLLTDFGLVVFGVVFLHPPGFSLTGLWNVCG